MRMNKISNFSIKRCCKNIAKDWTGSHVFAEPLMLMKCGGMPDIWSGHKLPFNITGSFAEDKIPRGEYLERDIWWSIINIIT